MTWQGKRCKQLPQTITTELLEDWTDTEGVIHIPAGRWLLPDTLSIQGFVVSGVIEHKRGWK